MREFHSNLEKALVEKAVELRNMSPDNFRKILDYYLRFYEAKILRAFYRSRFFPEAVSEISGDILFRVGEINKIMLQRLHETKTIADLNTVMASTKYRKVFEKNYDSIEGMAKAAIYDVDFIYAVFGDMLKKIRVHDGSHILELMNIKFDIINILVLVKCIVREVDKGRRKGLLVKNDGFVRKDLLVEADDIIALVDACKGSRYAEAMNTAMEKYSKDSMLLHFEIELYRLFKKVLVDSELYHVQGPYPLFSYFLKKEIEVKNIMAASKGIDSGFSKEEIRELLI